MDKITELLQYVHRTNPEMTREKLIEELTPEQLGKLVDSFYECYGAGKNA